MIFITAYLWYKIFVICNDHLYPVTMVYPKEVYYRHVYCDTLVSYSWSIPNGRVTMIIRQMMLAMTRGHNMIFDLITQLLDPSHHLWYLLEIYIDIENEYIFIYHCFIYWYFISFLESCMFGSHKLSMKFQVIVTKRCDSDLYFLLIACHEDRDRFIVQWIT